MGGDRVRNQSLARRFFCSAQLRIGLEAPPRLEACLQHKQVPVNSVHVGTGPVLVVVLESAICTWRRFDDVGPFAREERS